MSLQSDLAQTLSVTPENLARFGELIEPEWITQALAATGKASIRRRRIPAEHVVWLVIGLALFRDQPIWHIVRQLDLALDTTALLPAPSAAIQGRQRLGDEPLAHLFHQLATTWGQQATPQAEDLVGLATYAVDGVVWSAPDTPENRAQLGCCSNQHGLGGWPQIRAVCLMNTGSHELLDAALGGMDQGELTLAAHLQAPEDSLTLFDRAYFSAAFLLAWQHRGRACHWLMRAKNNLRYEVLARYATGDCWVRMPVSPRARQLQPTLPLFWEARLIEVSIDGRLRRFLTSLSDVVRYPAKQVAEHYQQRWEIELGFREIKQSLLGNAFVLRSKQPALVRQELWGVLIAYNLMRRQMRVMASHINVPPQRISFQWALIALIDLLRFAPLESAGNLPKRLALLYDQTRLFLLPPRRKRSFPRVVKLKPSFPRKMPVRT